MTKHTSLGYCLCTIKCRSVQDVHHKQTIANIVRYYTRYEQQNLRHEDKI